MAGARLDHDDVLLGALVLERPESATFPGVSRVIHEAVYCLAESYPDLLRFHFSPDTAYRYSEDLATSLTHLQRSRLIGMKNPDFGEYFVQDAAVRVFQQVLERKGIDGQTVQRLRSLSKELWRMLKSSSHET